MTTSAVVMMLVAVLVLWGGLALAVTNLVRQGPPSDEGEVGEGRADR